MKNPKKPKKYTNYSVGREGKIMEVEHPPIIAIDLFAYRLPRDYPGYERSNKTDLTGMCVSKLVKKFLSFKDDTGRVPKYGFILSPNYDSYTRYGTDYFPQGLNRPEYAPISLVQQRLAKETLRVLNGVTSEGYNEPFIVRELLQRGISGITVRGLGRGSLWDLMGMIPTSEDPFLNKSFIETIVSSQCSRGLMLGSNTTLYEFVECV